MSREGQIPADLVALDLVLYSIFRYTYRIMIYVALHSWYMFLLISLLFSTCTDVHSPPLFFFFLSLLVNPFLSLFLAHITYHFVRMFLSYYSMNPYCCTPIPGPMNDLYFQIFTFNYSLIILPYGYVFRFRNTIKAN